MVAFFVFAFAKAQEPAAQDSTKTGVRLGKLELPDPPSITELYIYDPNIDRYVFQRKLGVYNIGYPFLLTREEYAEKVRMERMREYFKNKQQAVAGKTEEAKEQRNNLIPNLYVNSDWFQTIFGGNTIEFIPQGSIEVDLGLLYTRTDNPALSPRNRSNFTFDFDQRINMSLVGNVGTRLTVNANYDTESTFDFQNQMKLQYNPDEDAILQNLEIGNVSLPLNSNLIRGAQSLFGVRADLQFGKTTVTAIFSEQQSESRTVQAEGGASIEDFDFYSLDYDENRHFFLSHYFRDTYDETLENYPFINSNVQITRVEVWVTNRQTQTQDVRNVVAIQDLGESDPENIGLDTPPANFINVAPNSFPSNTNNDFNPLGINSGTNTALTSAIREISTVQQGFGSVDVNEGFDYVLLENARKLNPNEYTLNTQLGYISLQQRLNNDEVLAVAFQYTVGGRVFQVGEFANDGVNATQVGENQQNPNQPVVTNQTLVLKMLKSNLTNVAEPIWDLMMKNIYNLSGNQLSQEDFRLNIFYQYPPELNYITPAEGTPTNPSVPLPGDVEETTLIRVFNLDRLNQQGDPQPAGDGFFDYIPGLTVDPQNGRIIFTSVEPFGEYIFNKLDNTPDSGPEDYSDPSTYNANQARYVYREMYNTTKFEAQESADKNRYRVRGEYKASGQEGIPVGGFNLPRGSVTVTAGGRTLQEGVDYSVDYQLGRVIILDQALLNSNTPIQVSTESNTAFRQQTKRFAGVNVEHQFNEDFLVGGTLLNLSERPVTQKSTIGYEPINNTIAGVNFNYQMELPFLTRFLNKLPNIDTDVPSNISVRGEFAYLFPGSPRGDDFEGEATSYVDDFEGAQTTISILSAQAWHLASTPIGLEGMAQSGEDPALAQNYRRARMAWYTIDPVFYGNNRPDGITDSDVSDYRTRRVFIDEIFPNVDVQQGQQQVVNTLDLAYYPEERGSYNFNPDANGTNTLPNPQDNWAGIMRQFSSTNFEQTNVEYVQFWLMDPFIYDPTNQGGTISVDLGSISEDILPDGRKQYENGLPEDGGTDLTAQTVYGKVPVNQSLIYAFDTQGAQRNNQDIGFDGLDDAEEQQTFPGFANLADPAADNYEFYLSASGDILERYKRYNNNQGNSPTDVSQDNRGSTTLPDVEDINRDNTMNTINSYFKYDVPIFPGMNIDNNDYIFDSKELTVTLEDGSSLDTRWVQFRIPLNDPNRDVINEINDFRAIRFMRLYLSEFAQNTYLRFGAMDLVRGDYRRYTASLEENDPNPDDDGTTFELESVNIENNESRQPIPYRLPPGIRREELRNQNQNIRQNEQSLAIRVCDLETDDARAVFKNFDVDMRQYESLRMFVHLESLVNEMPLEDGEMEAFIRLGIDFTNNFYEVRIPLSPTPFGSESRREIWPEENELNFDLSLLQQVKTIVLGDPAFPVNELNLFSQDQLGGGSGPLTVGIKGNPNFGDVRTIMLGVRNASNQRICGEVWFNEMRLAGLKNEGGWAALVNVDANLADFGNVTAVGRRSTIGFGAIEEGPNERSREDIQQYDITTSANFGQLLPKRWGVQIPFSYNIAEELITPQFDPQFEDIELETRLENAASDAERDIIREQSEDYTRRQSVNIIGLTKNRTGNKVPMPYDIENFTLSGSYNQTDRRNFEIEEFIDQSVDIGGLYNYAFPKSNVEPFKNIGFLQKSNYLKFIRDLNINLLPNNFTAGLNVIRQYNRQKFRDLQLDTNPVDLDGDGVPDAQNIAIAPLTNRNFQMNHNFAVNYDVTRSLQVAYNASSNRIIRDFLNEDGTVDESYGLWTDFFAPGLANQHQQQLQTTYEVPFNKFPFLAFAKASISYTSDFNWQRSSRQFQQLEDIPDLGNTVQNANTKTLNSTLDLGRFYKYLGLEKKKFTAAGRGDDRRRRSRGRSRQINPRGRENEKEKPKEAVAKESFGNKAYNTLIGLVTSVKRATINYQETNGIFLPGYLPDVGFLGTTKPSLGFIFGSQAEIRREAARNGWLTLYQDFNLRYSEVETRSLDYNINVDLLKDLDIDLIGSRSYQETFDENYQVDLDGRNYRSLAPNTYGNFNISTFMLGTAFSSSSINESANFETFKDNRLPIAERLARRFYGTEDYARDAEGFPRGFSRNSQSVLLPAFLAAYEGKDPEKIELGAFRDVPIPNWNIKYTGLMNLKWFQKNFNRFSLQHGYRSTYTINQFQTNLDYIAPNPDLDYSEQNPLVFNQTGDFKPRDLYFNVNLAEQFSPLINVDMEMKNGFNLKTEVRRDRVLSLSFDNNLLTEVSGNEYILGVGYRFKDLRFTTNFGGRQRIIKSDLNLRLDGSVRENLTVTRYLDIDNSQATAGQTIYTARFTADYALSQNITAIFYYDHTFSEYAISTAFPQSTIRSGLTIRYAFGN